MGTGARLGATLALLGLAACGEAGPEALSVELGTGETRFEPVTDGQEVPLVFGPQGGHHVFISFRAAGLPSGRAEMDLDVVPLGTVEPPPRAAPVRVILRETDEPGTFEYIGWPAILPGASCYVGVPLSCRLTLTSEEGAVATAEVVLVPGGDAPGLEPCEN